MIQKIRESFITKVIALTILPGILIPVIPGASANGGPVDTNFQGAGGSSEMVDLSSGDFNYSIPLLDVGGYPITLSYNSDITMDEQASMVGLGWTINTGAITRTVRGLPDDFDGDEITTEMNLRPKMTIANIFSTNMEGVGLDIGYGNISLTSLQLGWSFDNYMGNENIIGYNGNIGWGGANQNIFLFGGRSSSTRSGLSTSLGVSLSKKHEGHQFRTSLGVNRNSLHGTSLNVSYGYSRNTELSKSIHSGENRSGSASMSRAKRNYGFALGGSYPLGMQTYTPTATFEFHNKSWSFDLGAGVTPIAGLDFHGTYQRTKNTQCLKYNTKSQKAYGYLNQEAGYNENAIQDFNLDLPQVHENLRGINTPIPTNDYFYVSNTGTMFRAVRNDAGYVKDPSTKTEGTANSISGDAGFGGISIEGGINYAFSWNKSTTGSWETDNPFSDEPSFAFGMHYPSAQVEMSQGMRNSLFSR